MHPKGQLWSRAQTRSHHREKGDELGQEAQGVFQAWATQSRGVRNAKT